MFTAYALALSHAPLPREVSDARGAAGHGASHLEVAEPPPMPSREQLEAKGRNCRKAFITQVAEKIQRGDTCCGLGIHEMLIDVSDIDASARPQKPLMWPEVLDYFRRMRMWRTRDCWGGAAELTVLAHMSASQIFLLENFPCDAEWQLLTDPIGPCDWKQRIALAYSGTHYDAVRLPFGSWDALQERAGS